MNFDVKYVEKLEKTIEIEATDERKAREIAEQKYIDQEVTLCSGNYSNWIDIAIGKKYEDGDSFETSEGATGTVEPIDETINLTPFFDDMEDTLWNIFRQYARCAGIIFEEDSEIDFSIAKEISENILDIIQREFGRTLY